MHRFDQPILVTRPYLPPLDGFKRGLEEVWANQWLTNNGPIHRRFQAAMARYLDIPETNLALFVNGTLALELGFYALGLSGGDVITTPFTFVATSHALKRIGATPVFADVDPETLCLSPAAAEKLITSRTRAIVPVHVYGHPCDVEGFARLGEKYNIKIVYDAAHAFGVTIKGRSIAEWGDMSMFSFHPTKLYHSCEGGLLVFRDAELQTKLFNLRNFAIRGELECVDVGSNAKMNELQALMGLECLKAIDMLLESRARIHAVYKSAFAECPSIRLLEPILHGGGDWRPNHAYCPVLFADESTRERVYEGLKAANVFTRRYFYPLLTDFAPYVYGRGSCPVAEDVSRRILTLPTYYGLDEKDARIVAENVKEIVG